jgi:C-terminal processing protease CtpA/Prc
LEHIGHPAGSCLTMNIVPLPHDALLIYPFGQSQTPDGRALEDNGVVPDIEVALDHHIFYRAWMHNWRRPSIT